MRIETRHFALAAMIAAATVTPHITLADTTAEDSSHVRDLDEVIVVAQPKEQMLLRQQQVSSSVFSADEMTALGANDLRSLSAWTPNFVMPNYGSRYTSSMYVRGIGSRINSPAVGIYMDGMPLMSKSAFNTHFYDIERVDILRGPQGTLYGMNTEGGLVRIYSKSPLRYQGTDVQAGIGTHLYQNYQLTHYAKFSDKLGLMAGGFYNSQKGFFKNTFLNKRADKYQEAGGRVRVEWMPTNRWNINAIGDYQYVHQNGFPYGQLDPETGETSNPTTNHLGKYRRNILNTAVTANYRGSVADFSATTSYQHLKDYLLMDIDYQPQDFMHMEERQRLNSLTEELVLKSSRPGFWRWTFGGFFSTQWMNVNAPVYFDDDMDNFLGNNIGRAMKNAMVASMAGRFMAQPGMTEERARAMAEAAIERAGGVSLTTDMHTVPTIVSTPTTNLGFFHESNFEITPRLTATIGLRYDYSYVSIDYNTSAQMTSTANVMGTEATVNLNSQLKDKCHNHFDELLPKFGLTYNVGNRGSNVYATVSKGYRSGGYNFQMFSDILQADLQANSSSRSDLDIPHDAQYYERIRHTIAYKPETSWNYEAGVHLNLFNNSLHFDFSAFYMHVRNQQLSVMAGTYGFARMMTNAGKSHSCGVEATMRGSAFNDRMTYRLSYGFTHAVFEDYKDSVTTGGTATVTDYKDKKIPFVPAHTLAATVDYKLPLPYGFVKDVTIGVNMNAQGKTWWDEANTYSQKFYAVMGAHAAIGFGPVNIDCWVSNLTQTHYNTFAVSSAATGRRLYFAQKGAPLQCGVDVKWHF